MQDTPKVFISYSHDNEDHKNWVLNLATRLEENGVAVTLDQWDLKIGDDLPQFMESGLTDADRVILICTEKYVEKANAMKSGGVGYEKMIITAQIMQDLGTNRVIPIVVNNNQTKKVPTFVSSKLYLNFEESEYENSYCSLIADLWGESVKPRPRRGVNPFLRMPTSQDTVEFDVPKTFSNSALKATVTFNPTHNDGQYWVGEGEMAFQLKFSRACHGAIWIYIDTASIHSMRIVDKSIGEISEINDAESEIFYGVEKHALLKVNEIAVLQNINGYYLAIKIVQSLYRDRDADEIDQLTFDYVIAQAKSTSFSKHI
jgi:hypothetical protein